MQGKGIFMRGKERNREIESIGIEIRIMFGPSI